MIQIYIDVYENDSDQLKELIGAFGEEILSTKDQIKVVEILNKYRIIYTDNIFNELHAGTTVVNLNKILTENMGAENEVFQINFNYYGDETSEKFQVYTELVDAMELLIITKRIDGESINLVVNQSSEDDIPEDNDEYEEEYETDEDDDEDDFEPAKIETVPFLEDDDDEDADPFDWFSVKPKIENLYVSKSAVIATSKHARKQIRHHGIVVASKRSYIEKDRAVIKAFLKKFIPGKSAWIKQYRNRILKRWMKTYMIDRKTMKKFEKYYRSKKNEKKKKNLIGKAAHFLHSDPWNDPNK